MAVVSILAVLSSGAALESIEKPGPADWEMTAAAPATAPRSLPTSTDAPSPSIVPSDSTTTTRLPPELPATTTSTTAPDLTMEDITEMRPEPVVEGSSPMVFAPGVAFSPGAGIPFDPPVTREDCIRDAKAAPLTTDGVYERNLVAQMTHEVFECLTAVAGLDEIAPTALRRWNGAAVWGFGSLAEQVASEAVVVAYCESEGFKPRALAGSNGFGYAGLFQMGSVEMRRFGEAGSSRFDPADSAVAAANYFLYQYRNGAGWGGWSPWAVINTNFNDEVNDRVKIPVLPRFVSTDPEFRGRPGPELPAWAVDPWEWSVPHWRGTGCPYTGGGWPAAVPRS